MTEQCTQLLFNTENGHGNKLASLFSKAVRLDCMVAFANTAGLKFILSELELALSKGLEARFAIGLDFYQTSPELLQKLFILGKSKNLKLYVSNSIYTFHPKVYAFSHKSGCTIITGSANLTAGGFEKNHEASTIVTDSSGAMMLTVSKYFDELIEDENLVLASQERLSKYAHEHAIYHTHHAIAHKQFKRAIHEGSSQTLTLRTILAEMKADNSEDGFSAQQLVRRTCREDARDIIKNLAVSDHLKPEAFVKKYEDLIRCFHSGGLHRGKNIIAQSADLFLAGLADLVKTHPLEPVRAYKLLLKHFVHVDRAGVNVITEILHAIDSRRFAVMNQNAVSGLSMARIHDFPSKPTKGLVSAEKYALFCQKADEIRQDLGLNDFSELDALFNYAYWRETDTAEDEEE